MLLRAFSDIFNGIRPLPSISQPIHGSFPGSLCKGIKLVDKGSPSAFYHIISWLLLSLNIFVF